MAEKISVIEAVKAATAVSLVFAGIAVFYYFSDKPMIVRVGAVLAGLVAGAVLSLTTDMGQRFKAYAQESVEETRKVVWPTRKETLQTTAIVFVFVVIMALFLWMVDGSLLWAIKKLIGRGDV